MPDESAQASMGRSWNRVALFATGGALLLMVLALVNHSTAPLPPPRKLSLEAYTAFLSDYIQEFRKLLLVLARKAAELEQRGVQASKAAASLEAEHRSLGNALNERLLLKHRFTLAELDAARESYKTDTTIASLLRSVQDALDILHTK